MSVQKDNIIEEMEDEIVHEIGKVPVEKFVQNGLSKIVGATKTVNTYPSGQSRDLYCTYPTYMKVINQQSNQILSIISKVMKHQEVKGNIERRHIDEQFEMMLEGNDLMLERINSNLDELAGIKKNPQTIVPENNSSSQPSGRGAGSWNTKVVGQKPVFPVRKSLPNNQNISKPQLKFKKPVDNSIDNPFVPTIKEKPNSLKPLAVLPEYDEYGNIESYLHPYEFELEKFEPTPNLLEKTTPKYPQALDKTPFSYIDTVEQLHLLLADLRSQKEIGVDVEHHSYRSFLGITCLLQISSRDKDYVIDTLALRDELHILNEVFTNPKVVKIFHGADLDVEWLQRDLSIYIVNLFDTHQASKLLNYPRLSLAYLLKYYCNVEADKSFQLADWRVRPLSDDLIKYAREDTHYLIYIYENIKNDLLSLGNQQENLLKTVFKKSVDICMKRYFKPIITTDSYMEMYRKSKRIFDNRQLYALNEVYRWRDKTAREEDESYSYVLPNHMLLQICENLPREMQGILACCNPIPPLVRQNMYVLHQIILKAREQSLVKPIMEDELVNREDLTNLKVYNNTLYCRLDLSHLSEFRDDLPTLINSPQKNVKLFELGTPQISIFKVDTSSKNQETNEKLESIKRIKFVSPYDRYKAVLPFIEKERLEEAARNEALNRKKILCPIKLEPTNLPIPENVTVKQEPEDLTIKESLKRKHNIKNKNEAAVIAKKSKEDQNDTDSLKFNQSKIISKNSKKEEKSIPTDSTNNLEVSMIPKIDSNTRQRKKKIHGKSAQSSNQPVQFDYKNVDFKKFQGGAQRAKGTEIKAKVHGKGSNKATNKSFNKLFTFSNVNKKKK